MVCKPNKWSDKLIGGYLENKEGIISYSSFHKHTTTNLDVIYNVINRINSQKFRINNLLLNFLKNEGIYLINSNDEGDKS